MAATRTARKTTTRKPAPKPAPVEPEEDFDEELTEDEDGTEVEQEDEELEELEADEVSETKPKGKSSAATEVTFGIQELCTLIKDQTGQETTPRAIRTLIRKMARDGSGRVDREIVPGNRQRYDWSGPNDPEVVAIVEAFKGGELEAEKQAKLAKLKEDKAKKTAAKKAAAAAEDDGEAKPTTRKKPAAKKAAPARRTRKAPEPVEEVEDDDELDLDEE